MHIQLMLACSGLLITPMPQYHTKILFWPKNKNTLKGLKVLSYGLIGICLYFSALEGVHEKASIQNKYVKMVNEKTV